MVIKRSDEMAKLAEYSLKKNGGYCPCRVEKTPSTKCRCREFNINCMQHDWYGKCRCGLYEKVREE